MTGSGASGHMRAHALALSMVGVASIVGALAAFAFQVATARLLGTEDFGLLAAFFAIVNVAAIGSSALQNSVTVQTATLVDAAPGGARVPLDALLLGLVGGALVAALAGPLGAALGTSTWIVVMAATSIPMSFVFAAYLGRIQGAGRAGAAVSWSTASLLIRLAIAAPALLLGAGVGGAVGAVVVASALALVGAAITARKSPAPPSAVLTSSGVIVMVITIALAWLTSADVFYLRVYAGAENAGAYAAVAVLVKATFILPSTLSMYLLPRFARNRSNPQLTRLGVCLSVASSALAGLAILLVFWLTGSLVIDVIYGHQFASSSAYLVPVAAAYLPWIVLQGMLIQLTSSASLAAAITLAGAVGVQWVVFFVLLPDVHAALTGFGVLGVLLCAVLALYIRRGLARHRPQFASGVSQ